MWVLHGLEMGPRAASFNPLLCCLQWLCFKINRVQLIINRINWPVPLSCECVCIHSVILLLALHLALFTMIGMLLFAKNEVSLFRRTLLTYVFHTCFVVINPHDLIINNSRPLCLSQSASLALPLSLLCFCSGPREEWRVGSLLQKPDHVPDLHAGAAHYGQQPRWYKVGHV